MKRKHTALTIVGVIVLSLLLIYWLYTATLMEETENLQPAATEQAAE